MSTDDQGGAGRREVAYRAFATEYDDADLSYSESDEERAPNYVVLPTGARVNRLFVVGVLTAVEQASEEVLRARLVDPTGAFVVYAGQYQPDALAFLERTDPPAFVALSGKARTFQPEDSEVTYASVRPESANEVDADTRDRWTVQCAARTLDRIGTAARALTYEERGDELRDRLAAEGVDAGLAAGIPLAFDHYGTTATYLDAVGTTALEAAEVVAGERDEVELPGVRPDESGTVEPASLISEGTDRPVDDSAGKPAAGSAAADPSSVAVETDDDASASAQSADSTGTASPTAADASDSPDAESSAAGEQSGTLEDFDPDEFELDEEEREEIEREYGTDFQTGSEVDEPGEADIDTGQPEDPAAGASGAPTERPAGDTDAGGDTPTGEPGSPSTGSEVGVGDSAADGTETTGDGTNGESSTAGGTEAGSGETPEEEPLDLEEAVMEAMRANDGGTGAPKSDVVATVLDSRDVTADAVEDAIQDALMDGRCYEPEDGVYKPI